MSNNNGTFGSWGGGAPYIKATKSVGRGAKKRLKAVVVTTKYKRKKCKVSDKVGRAYLDAAEAKRERRRQRNLRLADSGGVMRMGD